MCFSPSLPPIILLHFVCQLWKTFHQFCVPEAKARLLLHNHSNTDGRHTVELIGFCKFIMVITEHSGLQNLIPQCIVQRLNWCPFGQCERWCNGYERSWENRGDWGKWGLEFVPGIFVPSCRCVTVGCNIWQYLTFHLGPSSTHVPSASWATNLSVFRFLFTDSIASIRDVVNVHGYQWVRAQSAESEGRRGHSGTAMCNEYLSNHPASWISKQAECWAAFNIPLPSKRKKPQRSSSFFS